jgi:hypothetical protein
MQQLRGKASCHTQIGYNLLPASSPSPNRTHALLPSAFIVLCFFLKLDNMAGRILAYCQRAEVVVWSVTDVDSVQCVGFPRP